MGGRRERGQRVLRCFDRGLASIPVWSRDGQVDLLSARVDPLPGLVAKRIDDRVNEFPVADRVRPVYDARVWGDGQWLVFEGAADGVRGIYVMTVTGTNLARLTSGEAADIQPVSRP